VTWYSEDATAVKLRVRVVPRASRSEIIGVHDDVLRVRLAAPPVDGAANRELLKLIAKRFKVPASAVSLVAGNNSKNKVVRIENPSREVLSKMK